MFPPRCFKTFLIPFCGLIILLHLRGAVLLMAQTPTESRKFELVGEVRWGEKEKGRRWVAAVILRGNSTPYSSTVWTDYSGKFKFKKLETGSYTLSAQVRHRGEKHMTIEISPSYADRRDRIRQIITVGPATSGNLILRPDVVSLRELSISEKARMQYAEAEKKLSRGELESGIHELEKVVKLAPHFVTAINRLGAVFHLRREYSKAEQCFREALQNDPKAFAPLVNLGGTLLSMEKFQEALEINKHAVETNPLDSLANAQLGMCYVALSEDDKAMGYLIRAKQLDPMNYSYPQLALAEIYRRRGQSESVTQELKEFLKLHPDAPEAKVVQQQIDDGGIERAGSLLPRH